MKDFTIYRVPSLKKVGCTRNFKKSCRERYPKRRVIILEIVPAKKGPKHAGDVEWKYAVKFGYKRRGHYLNTWDFKLTKKQRRRFAKLGRNNWTPEGAERIRNAGKWRGPKGVGAPGMSDKTKKRIARLGAIANGASPNNYFRQMIKCPHCGVKVKGASMRWHNC